MKQSLSTVLALALTLLAATPAQSATAVLQADIKPASDAGKSTAPTPAPPSAVPLAGTKRMPCAHRKHADKRGDDRKHWHHRKHRCHHDKRGQGKRYQRMGRRLDLIEARLSKIETMLEKLLMRY